MSESMQVIDTVGGLHQAMAQRAGVLGCWSMQHLAATIKDLGLHVPKRKADRISVILLAEFEVTATDQVLDVPVIH